MEGQEWEVTGGDWMRSVGSFTLSLLMNFHFEVY